jgi:hypothetical protein
MTLRARIFPAGCALLAALALLAHAVAFTLPDAGQVWALNTGWTLAAVVLVVSTRRRSGERRVAGRRLSQAVSAMRRQCGVRGPSFPVSV